jgi:hypothetical protein
MLDALDENTSAMWPAKYAYRYGHNIVQNDATNNISFTKESIDILQNILPEKNTWSAQRDWLPLGGRRRTPFVRAK